jgi:hypothetical protein
VKKQKLKAKSIHEMNKNDKGKKILKMLCKKSVVRERRSLEAIEILLKCGI